MTTSTPSIKKSNLKTPGKAPTGNVKFGGVQEKLFNKKESSSDDSSEDEAPKKIRKEYIAQENRKESLYFQ